MLTLHAKIYFDEPSENREALANDLNTKFIIRPSINFGRNQLFTGQIIVDESINVLKRGKEYIGNIVMLTMTKDMLLEVEDLISVGSGFIIQNGSRCIGKGEILDFFVQAS